MNIPNIGKNGVLSEILSLLPSSFRQYVEKEVDSLIGGATRIYELRIRAEGCVSLVTDGGIKRLSVRPTHEDVGDILRRLTGGALYAHRDTIARGFISTPGGIRVGICGRARYEGGEIVSVTEVRSLVFRTKGNEFDSEVELFDLWRRENFQGMLIYSPPGGGKTTAIRRLAARIGKSGKQVAVIDERCEFLPEDYRDAEVELLRGYKKSEGMEIAVRTLGAEVVIIDEIGATEAGTIASSLMLGIPLIATVHAASAEEILSRPAFSPLMRSGVFGILVGIVKKGGRRTLVSTTVASTA